MDYCSILLSRCASPSCGHVSLSDWKSFARWLYIIIFEHMGEGCHKFNIVSREASRKHGTKPTITSILLPPFLCGEWLSSICSFACHPMLGSGMILGPSRGCRRHGVLLRSSDICSFCGSLPPSVRLVTIGGRYHVEAPHRRRRDEE